MKVEIPGHMVTSDPCLKPIRKCVTVGFHDPACRCFLPAGHEDACLPAVSLAMLGGQE